MSLLDRKNDTPIGRQKHKNIHVLLVEIELWRWTHKKESLAIESKKQPQYLFFEQVFHQKPTNTKMLCLVMFQLKICSTLLNDFLCHLGNAPKISFGQTRFASAWLKVFQGNDAQNFGLKYNLYNILSYIHYITPIAISILSHDEISIVKIKAGRTITIKIK